MFLVVVYTNNPIGQPIFSALERQRPSDQTHSYDGKILFHG
jgi:hypothetical protein